GSVSRPIPHENGWYVYQILERRPPGLRPLEAVSDRARRAAVRAFRMARAKAAAEEARAAVLAGMSAEEAAKKYGGRFVPSKGVTRNGIISAVGRDEESVGTFMVLPEGTWSPVREGPVGALLVQVIRHNRPSEDDFKKQEATIRRSLLAEYQQAMFTEWFDSIRRRAKIEDYREEMFGA
ncbi:MAG TPA: peptidylprolyl isomerase, partial [Candidatus Eisenbacteria bacterium]